jgi:hypothetical protein
MGDRTPSSLTIEVTMALLLRLHEDVLASDARPHPLPPLPRMIFVVHGASTIGGRLLRDGEAWHGEGEAALAPGAAGATLWRWELAPPVDDGVMRGQGVVSREKLVARLDTLPADDLLLRGDSVAFPPGGCALTHTHQGPGIRCLIEGAIRIDTHGRSTSYGPGGAWFESGPEPVFAQAAADRASRFIRVMVLPRALIGQSSIRYVNPEDAGKPKSQQYAVFVDAPIRMTGDRDQMSDDRDQMSEIG